MSSSVYNRKNVIFAQCVINYFEALCCRLCDRIIYKLGLLMCTLSILETHLGAPYRLFPLSTVVRDTKFDFIFIMYFLSHFALLVALCKGLLSMLAMMFVFTSLTTRVILVHWKIKSELIHGQLDSWERLTKYSLHTLIH